jgi:hypothetical protein
MFPLPWAAVNVSAARGQVGRCRSLTRTILALDRELQSRIEKTAPALLALPGCGALSAAKQVGEIGPIERFDTDAQLARHTLAQAMVAYFFVLLLPGSMISRSPAVF